MEELNLPVIKEGLPPARALTMDMFVKFLRSSRKFYFNPKVYESWKKHSMVNTPFRFR